MLRSLRGWPMFLLGLAASLSSLPVGAQDQSRTFDCIIEPHRTVKIGSPVAGILDKVMVDRGDVVKESQVIGQLMSDVELTSVALARAHTQAEAQVRAAAARVDFEMRKLERSHKLYKKNIISDQDIDESQTELALRKEELAAAKEQLHIAELELKRAQAVLAIRTIRSSVNGVVVERTLSPGEFVLNDGHIVTMAEIDPLNVEVFMPIKEYPNIKVGMTGLVMPEEPIGGKYRATVTIVDRVIDAASGTFGVRFSLPNPDYAIPAGLRCKIHFDFD
jgi:RND family efflux transporter MFP subunit